MYRFSEKYPNFLNIDIAIIALQRAVEQVNYPLNKHLPNLYRPRCVKVLNNLSEIIFELEDCELRDSLIQKLEKSEADLNRPPKIYAPRVTTRGCGNRPLNFIQ